MINRAPVLTLWVAVVAQQQGFSREAALTFGRAISGLLAHSKGVSIGVAERKEKDPAAEERKRQREAEQGVEKVDVFGMHIKAQKANDEMHAVDANDKPINPATVDGYLRRAFGDRLSAAEGALKELAEAHPPDALGHEAYNLYSNFRPQVPQGQSGWGRKGVLELDRIHEMAQHAQRQHSEP
ncbi:hypothetical protein WJX72_005210 [[Myrmecia] bisecta]|uniref:Uncharacterized protein n=1 Tax=[Myrmecia] bisecta TaxID=41462 RepID=A0AAW1QQJ8_9CHLO